MVQAFKDFMKGVLGLPVGWQLWVALMLALNMVVPLFFISHTEAQVTLAAMIAGGMTGIVLVKIQGFTKLLGLMHIYWLPLVFYLFQKTDSISTQAIFGIWLWSVIVVNSLSLIIDTCDVISFFSKGKKAS